MDNHLKLYKNGVERFNHEFVLTSISAFVDSGWRGAHKMLDLSFNLVSRIWRVLCFSCTAFKNHRNGIKKPKRYRYPSLKGVSVCKKLHRFICLILYASSFQVDPKFLRNMRFAKKHNREGLKKQRKLQQPMEH